MPFSIISGEILMSTTEVLASSMFSSIFSQVDDLSKIIIVFHVRLWIQVSMQALLFWEPINIIVIINVMIHLNYCFYGLKL